MARLNGVTMRDLHGVLEEIEGNLAVQRVLAAIAYKQGDTTRRLAERHNVSQQTIRNWLDRFEHQPVTEAPYDAHRRGRPPKLSPGQRERFETDLATNPTDLGYVSQSWSPALAQHHLETEYGVGYSLRHVRRLMRDAGHP